MLRRLAASESPRGGTTSLAVAAGLALLAVWVCGPIAAPDHFEGYDHARTSIDLALNRAFCGQVSKLSSAFAPAHYLEDHAEALTMPAPALLSRLAGSVDAYCKTVLVPITHNENGLTALLAPIWAADPRLSAADVARVLYVFRVALVWLFGLACLRAGASIALTAVLIAGGVAVLNAMFAYQFTVYPFLLTTPLLWVGVCSLLYPAMRVASLRRAIVLAGVAGLVAAWLVNLRTASLPIVAALFVLAIAASVVWRRRAHASGGLAFAAASAAAFAALLVAASAAITSVVAPANPDASNYTHHTILHNLVIGLGVPPNALSRAEGISWGDPIGFAMARRADPNVSYLGPGYERALARYYAGLWRRRPREMIAAYWTKLWQTGHGVFLMASQLLPDSRPLRKIYLVWADRANGVELLLASLGATLVSLWALWRTASPLALTASLLGAALTLVIVESAFIYSEFSLAYHGFLMYMVLVAPAIALQAACDVALAPTRGRLTILRPGVPPPPAAAGETMIPLDEVREWVASGGVLVRLGRYADGRVLVHRIDTAGRPLPLALALRALCRGDIHLEDALGKRMPLTVARLARWSAHLATEPFRASALLRGVRRDVDSLERSPAAPAAIADLRQSPVYLRTDLSFGVRAGGSVGHIAGVLNELDAFTGPPIFITTDDVPTVRPDIERHHVAPGEAFWNFRELPTFVLNDAVGAAARSAIGARPIAFVYQRYSLNNYAGVRLARSQCVPLVLEYNGSEIWMSRHWGRALAHEALSERIERLNLQAADLIVVVSRAMQDELVARGVDCSKILVNVNGVDETRYSPDVDGGAVRVRFRLDGATVVGFIGTFGPWHGADVLARAFVSLVTRDSAVARGTRLLMIGDGAGLPAVRRLVKESGASDAVVFTGLVPQEAGPAHLAACDLLVSPHVPNPDGTPFFGSPTKLFEYMAMGKGIIASRLDQIGEVLEHGRNAWLVPPGDDAALAEAVRCLVADRELRERLGAQAREDVVARHTWRRHTRRTIDRLRAPEA
jgi:glycosyltransferase involved in cell wall biosynthesis